MNDSLNDLTSFINKTPQDTPEAKATTQQFADVVGTAPKIGSAPIKKPGKVPVPSRQPLIGGPALAEVGRFTAKPASEYPTSPIKLINPAKIFYTGRLKAGKDFVATKSGATIFSFAEPLYFLLRYFFGVTDKDANGAREFLQRTGQWGRGVVNAEYPLSTERATFLRMMAGQINCRFGEHAELDALMVDWDDFGVNNDIWLNSLVTRMEASSAARKATTNVRFSHEFKRLTEAGYLHYHVMTSPREWEDRIKVAGLDPQNPALHGYSESLAISLDKKVIAATMKQRTGGKLNVIWNSTKPVPSPRLYTVDEFCSRLGVAPTPETVVAAEPSESGVDLKID